jgi:hypothetical protein
LQEDRLAENKQELTSAATKRKIERLLAAPDDKAAAKKFEEEAVLQSAADFPRNVRQTRRRVKRPRRRLSVTRVEPTLLLVAPSGTRNKTCYYRSLN